MVMSSSWPKACAGCAIVSADCMMMGIRRHDLFSVKNHTPYSAIAVSNIDQQMGRDPEHTGSSSLVFYDPRNLEPASSFRCYRGSGKR